MNHRRTITVASPVAFAALTLGVIGLASTAGAKDSGSDRSPTLVVHPGESIQAAIDDAPPGATVVINEGSYRENLLIDHALTLRGRGAVLIEPPAVQTPNTCTESGRFEEPGQPKPTWAMCIVGELGPVDDQGVATVVTPLAGVTVSKVHVRGFTEGIVALGTDGLVVDHVEVDEHTDAGINIVRSTNAKVKNSYLHDNVDFAIKVSIGNGITLEGNRLIDTHDSNGQGLNVSQYRNVVIRGNEVAGNCTGIMIVDVVHAGVMRNVKVYDNDVHDNSRYCPGEGIPSASGNGILLGGVTKAAVFDNDVSHNVASVDPATGASADLTMGGIGLFDTTPFGGSAPAHNRVTDNEAHGNEPNDLFYDGSGTNVAFDDNDCNTSNVPGACG